MLTSPVMPRYQAASVAIHVAAIALLLWGFANPAVRTTIKHQVQLIDPAPALKPWLPHSGAGGGGQQQKLAATKGQLPKPAKRVFTPPMNELEAKLMMTPSILAPPDAPLPESDLNNWGDPLAALVNGSAGKGRDPGIGNNGGSGIGPGNGASYGPGTGNDFGPVYSSGGGITQPILIYSIDPDYSEDARKAKYSGVVSLTLIVDAQGQPRDIRVVKGLGMGLDEKAMDAVSRWKFRPGKKNGLAVNVRAKVEVSFRLL